MVTIGDRVVFKSEPGTVRFVGNTEFSGGIWCGVELDSAGGKNDGSVQGVRYFDCPPLCGIFVREPVLQMLDSVDTLDRKKRRQTSTGVSRAASRTGTRGVSRASMGVTETARSVSRASMGGTETVRSLSRSSARVSVTPDAEETARLKVIVTRLQDKLHLMHTEIESLKSSTSTLQELRAEAVIKSSKLEEDLEMMSIDKETVEEQNELLKQEISSLKEKNETLQQELDSLKEELQLAGDVGGSNSQDLTTRNEMLEQALLKLRDHTDELQIQLERALIDANKNNEVPKEFVEENARNKEKLSQYEKKIKELEDLRSEEADLEKIHIETEHELQQEIRSLEFIIGEKQAVIATLEHKNNDLSTVLATLKKESDREVTFDFKKFEEYKIRAANLQREKQSLQLDFKLLNLEVQMREKILLLTSVSSGAIETHRTTGQLEKYADVYRVLGDAVEVNADDLYLSVLGISVKFSLFQFSLVLEFVSSVQRDSSIILKLHDLEAVTQDFVHHIKEQELRNVPSLQEIQDDILSQLIMTESHFPQRLQLDHQAKQHRLSLQIVQEVVSKVNTQSIKNNVEQTPELTKLYQSTLQHMEWITSLIDRLEKEKKESNEITKYELNPLSSEVKTFINSVSDRLTSLDFSSGKVSLIKEINNLINALESLPTTSPEWITEKVVIPQDVSLSHDAEELQRQLISTQSTLEEKSTLLEESTSRIEVLQARLQHLRDTEVLVKKYRSQIESLTITNEGLNVRVGELMETNEKIGNELHMARNNNLLHNSQFETLLEQKQYTERASLVSEIEVLQRTVRYYTSKNANAGKSWLKKELKLFKPYDRQLTQVDELRNIGKDLQRAMARSHNHQIIHS